MQRCSRAKRTSRETSIAWIEPALRERTTNAGSPGISGGSWTISGASGLLAARTTDSNARLPAVCDESCDRDGPQPVDEAVEEEQEEEQVGGHQDAGHGDADVRDGVLLDPRQQREREGERPDQHRQQDLQDLVPVPEAHVAGREAARRHLDDEDADGDHEAGQGSRRPHDRGQQRGRGRRRVLERGRDRDPAGEDRLEQAEHGSCDAAQQRQEPEAPLQVLACLEVERPHGTACHTAPEQFARIIPLG